MTKRLISFFIFIFPIILIGWIAAVNRFPEGYTYSGGDTFQIVNIKDSFKDLFYVWNNKLAAPGEGGFFSWFNSAPYFFFFFYVPAKLGLSSTQALSYVLFWFLTFSYLSFWLSLKAIFARVKNPVLVAAFSLVYAVNPTTLYFFTYTWGFSHQVLLYLFIPVLCAAFIKLLEEKRAFWIFAFTFWFIISSVSFVNAAFLVALGLYLALILFLFLFLKLTIFNFRLLVVLFLTGLLSLLGLSYWLWPIYFFASAGLSGILHGLFDLKSWLAMQSVSLWEVFRNLVGYLNFNIFFRALSLLPYLLVALSLLKLGFLSRRSQRLVAGLLTILIFLLILLKKSQAPFSFLTLAIFQIPLLTTLRSYEKIAIFIPFTLILLLYLFWEGYFWKKYQKLSVLILVGLLLAPFPFWFGGIETKYSVSFPAGKDYKTGYFASLVKIPSDYFEMANFANQSLVGGNIQALPFGVINSLSWLNYPKWQLSGIDPTTSLFKKNIVSQISSFYPLNEALSLNSLDPLWYAQFLGTLNVSEILFHKDARADFVTPALVKLKNLEDRGVLKKLKETENLILYSLSHKFQAPHFYIPTSQDFLDSTIERLPYFLNSNYSEAGFSYLIKEGFINQTVGQKVSLDLSQIPSFSGGQVVVEARRKPESSGCYYCYDFSVPEEGPYAVLVKGAKSLVSLELNGQKSQLVFNKNSGDYKSEGVNFPSGKERSFNLTFDQKENLIKSILGKSADLLLTGRQDIPIYSSLGEEFIRSLLPLRENLLFSVDVARWSPNQRYKFSFEHLEKDWKMVLIVLEKYDEPQMDGAPDKGVKIIGRGAAVINHNFTSRQGPPETWEKIETEIKAGPSSHGAKILFYFYAPPQGFSGDQVLRNLGLEEVEDPVVFLKKERGNQISVQDLPRLNFSKANPTFYRLRVTNPRAISYSLVFSESFNKWWRVYKVPSQDEAGSPQTVASYFDGRVLEGPSRNEFLPGDYFGPTRSRPLPEASHFIANGYANAWFIEPEMVGGQKDYDLIVEFWPQRIFYYGLGVSGVVFLATIIFLLGHRLLWLMKLRGR